MTNDLVEPPAGWHWEKRASKFFHGEQPCALDLLLVEDGRRTAPSGFYLPDDEHDAWPPEPYYRRGVPAAWQARGVSRAIVREWRHDDRLQRRFRRYTR